MVRSKTLRFRQRLVLRLHGRSVVVKSINRHLQQQKEINSAKVSAAGDVVESIMQSHSEVMKAGQMTTDVVRPATQPQKRKLEAEVAPRSAPVTAFEVALNSGNVVQMKHTKRPVTQTQGGGRGMCAQTGKVINTKPNDGRLHIQQWRKKQKDDEDASPGYVPRVSSSSEESPPNTPPRKRKKRKQNQPAVEADDGGDGSGDQDFLAARTEPPDADGRNNKNSGNANDDDAEDNGADDDVSGDHDDDGDDSEGGRNDSDNGDNDVDHESSQEDEEDEEDEDVGDQNGDSDEERTEEDESSDQRDAVVETPKLKYQKLNDIAGPSTREDDAKPVKRTRFVDEGSSHRITPNTLPHGHIELPSTFVDEPDKGTADTDSSGTDDNAGNETSFATQLAFINSGIILDHDPADETFVEEDEMTADDPRHVVVLSKRAKYYEAMVGHKMGAFYRIRRHNANEAGCYLTLGNPPNTFELSDGLRVAAEDEAYDMFHSFSPFNDKKKGREVRFKEKVWNEQEGRRVKLRFGPQGVAAAEAMHKFSATVLTAMLKTATLGSTFYEKVNMCSFGTSPSVAMMLRCQVEPYRTVFTCGYDFARRLFKNQFGKEMPEKTQRMIVYEAICRTKQGTRSRVTSHKVDNQGVKIELAKRKIRNEVKDSIDF